MILIGCLKNILSYIKKWINSNQKNGTAIDDKGICNACNYHELKKKINWKKREDELLKILDIYRGKTEYDCVVPGSGGKDSGYKAHILKYKFLLQKF